MTSCLQSLDAAIVLRAYHTDLLVARTRAEAAIDALHLDRLARIDMIEALGRVAIEHGVAVWIDETRQRRALSNACLGVSR